jgi:hypothetical protein
MNNILLKLGIQNDDEHWENCCCESADSVDNDDLNNFVLTSTKA